MSQQEINNELPLSNNSYACAPFCTNESIFFQLILNTSYENTKENCLIFLRNYSKKIIITKRDLFKTIITELILTQRSNKSLENNNNLESLYLIRTFINNYSMNNIINALYDFITEKDEININKIINEKKEDFIDEQSIMNQSMISINSSVNKKKKNSNFLSKKRKIDLNEDIKDILNNKKNKNIEDIKIKEEKFDENDKDINNILYKDNHVKIKTEKDDFFKKSFFFEENDDYKTKLRNRNKSLGLKNISKYNLRNFISLSRKKRQFSFSKEKSPVHKKKEKENKILKLDEENLRSHIIKIKDMIISYKIMKYQNHNSKKIIYLCNNEKCKGKGVYLIEKNIFKETEKHNFKFAHNISVKLKNFKDMLIKEKTCDGYQILKNDEFIKDKKVIYLK